MSDYIKIEADHVEVFARVCAELFKQNVCFKAALDGGFWIIRLTGY